jgi:hypothetical protein
VNCAVVAHLVVADFGLGLDYLNSGLCMPCRASTVVSGFAHAWLEPFLASIAAALAFDVPLQSMILSAYLLLKDSG